MANKHQLAITIFFILLSTCLGKNLFAQTEKDTSLTRNDIVIHSDMPSIYLCVDNEKNKSKKVIDSEKLWLRIYNNTVWTLKFNTQKMGNLTKALKLTNGSIVGALSNKTTFYPHYQFESKKIESVSKSLWSDINTTSWLPPDSYAVFNVPSQYFAENVLFLGYKYEWELIGAAGQESYSPVHRIYFNLIDSLDISKNLCR